MSPNGKKIAFVKNKSGDLYVMNADGTDHTRIFNKPLASFLGWPRFSPNGKKIAFTMNSSNSEADIYVISTHGTGLTHLTNMKGDEFSYVWSRDGTKIFFLGQNVGGSTAESSALPPSQYYEINADGSRLKKVSNSPTIVGGWSPTPLSGWSTSPECKEIAFVRDSDHDLYVRSPDGRETQITHSGNAYWSPFFSPECKNIAFMRVRTPAHRRGQQYSEIYVINVDGTGLTRLTKGHADQVIGWSSNTRAPSSAATHAESGGLSPMLVVAASALALLLAGGVIAATLVHRY